jgi:hypothetical protein
MADATGADIEFRVRILMKGFPQRAAMSRPHLLLIPASRRIP